jgi:hypothetical protein
MGIALIVVVLAVATIIAFHITYATNRTYTLKRLWTGVLYVVSFVSLLVTMLRITFDFPVSADWFSSFMIFLLMGGFITITHAIDVLRAAVEAALQKIAEKT